MPPAGGELVQKKVQLWKGGWPGAEFPFPLLLTGHMTLDLVLNFFETPFTVHKTSDYHAEFLCCEDPTWQVYSARRRAQNLGLPWAFAFLLPSALSQSLALIVFPRGLSSQCAGADFGGHSYQQ
jgi:hypothetical protein